MQIRKQAVNLLLDLYKTNPKKVHEYNQKFKDNIYIMQQIGQLEGTQVSCEFCGLESTDFFDNKKLEAHKKQCYMLTVCVGCNVTVEV
jgi:hypothetical protein